MRTKIESTKTFTAVIMTISTIAAVGPAVTIKAATIIATPGY